MSRKIIAHLTLVVLFAGMLFAPVVAFGQKGNQMPRSIKEKEYQGVPYMSGGIGEGQREAMQKLETKYNLKAVYAVKQGNYLAMVDTVITNAQGKTVLKATAQGPWLYAKLPAGTYTMTATTLRGKTQEARIQVPPQGLKVIFFTWERSGVHK